METWFLSLGENCLPDHILNRYGLKSFATPFSHGRSNIEYILNLERDNYRDFLNTDCLAYDYLGETKVVRQRKYKDVTNVYHYMHRNGFEFTHHDVLENEEDRKKLLRRVERLQNASKQRIVFLYNHIVCSHTNMEQLFDDLAALMKIYQDKGNEVKIVMFYQTLISGGDCPRALAYSKRSENLHIFQFNTEREWAGNDRNLMLAIVDEDLVKDMIDRIKVLVGESDQHNDTDEVGLDKIVCHTEH
jgi:hypothetical protein